MSAHRISTEDLDQAIAQHARWLETAGRRGKRLDLTGHVLSGKNLSRLDLRASILKGAQLSWVNFSHANLSEADLCGAAMNHAVLNSAMLVGANLSGVNMRCTDLTGADLTEAILIETDMRGSIGHLEQQPARKEIEESAAPVPVVQAARQAQSSYTDIVMNRLKQIVSSYSGGFVFFQRLKYTPSVPGQVMLKPESIKII